MSGGGRYDGLVGMFSKLDIPAVGVSLGLERIITVMEELGMLPETSTTAQVLVTIHQDSTRAYAIEIAKTLRESGIPTELFLDKKKMKQQLKYANARGFRWVAFAGPDEVEAGTVTLKDFKSGDQVTVALYEAAQIISGSNISASPRAVPQCHLVASDHPAQLPRGHHGPLPHDQA